MAGVVDSMCEKVADKGEMNEVTKRDLSTTEIRTSSVEVDSTCEIKSAENGHVDVIPQLKTVETVENERKENETAIEGHKLQKVAANGSVSDTAKKTEVAQVETVDSVANTGVSTEAAHVDKLVANGFSEAETTVEETKVGAVVSDLEPKRGVADMSEDGKEEVVVDVVTTGEVAGCQLDGSPEAIIDVIGDSDAINGQNGLGVDEGNAGLNARKTQNGEKDGDEEGNTLAVVTNGAAKEDAMIAVEGDGEATKRKTVDAGDDVAPEKKLKLKEEEPVACLAEN